jgi:hypothetical protein
MKKLTEWKQDVVMIGVIVIIALAFGWKAQLQKKTALRQEKVAAHEAGDDGIGPAPISGQHLREIDR